MTGYYPLYHTIYETFDAVKNFIDPDFSFHKCMSLFLSELAYSLSKSIMIPFNTHDYASRLLKVHADLEKAFRVPLSQQGLDGSLGE